jgi:hypothetical protein
MRGIACRHVLYAHEDVLVFEVYLSCSELQQSPSAWGGCVRAVAMPSKNVRTSMITSLFFFAGGMVGLFGLCARTTLGTPISFLPEKPRGVQVIDFEVEASSASMGPAENPWLLETSLEVISISHKTVACTVLPKLQPLRRVAEKILFVFFQDQMLFLVAEAWRLFLPKRKSTAAGPPSTSSSHSQGGESGAAHRLKKLVATNV